MRLSLHSFVFSFTAARVFALPLSNATNVEPGWVSESKRRGTSSLLLSCIITLILCAWTAIHLNVIPSHSKDDPTQSDMWHWFCSKVKWERAKRLRILFKIGWMFTALFAPEIVLWCAFCQWIEAKAIHEAWCRHFGITKGKDLLGMEGAFFVVMGGFTIGPRGNRPGKACTITPRGFITILENGIIEHEDSLDKETIADKGKADILAKSLVCVQALWMVVQCAGRKGSGLPVTLLELHVVMHVVCAVIMYGFWWHKPLDVFEQISLTDGRELLMSLSYLYEYDSKITVPVPPEPKTHPPSEDLTPITTSAGDEPKVVPVPSESKLNLINEDLTPITTSTGDELKVVSVLSELPHSPDASSPPGEESDPITILNNLKAEAERLIPVNRSGLELIGRETTLKRLHNVGKYFHRDDILRACNMVEGLVRSLKGVTDNYLVILFDGESLVSSKDGFSITASQNTLEFRVVDAIDIGAISSAANNIREGKYTEHPWDGKEVRVQRKYGTVLKNRERNRGISGGLVDDIEWTLFLLISCCVVYGACHATAWNSHFPTPIERWLWRVSCLIIGVFPFFVAAAMIYDETERDSYLKRFVRTLKDGYDFIIEIPESIMGWLGWEWGEWFAEKLMGYINIGLIGVLIGILVLMGVLYVVVRVFLMIESFISLRSLQKGAYDTASWEAYWPHF